MGGKYLCEFVPKLYGALFRDVSPEASERVLNAFVAPFPSLREVRIPHLEAAFQGAPGPLQAAIDAGSAEGEWPGKWRRLDDGTIQLVPYVGDRWISVQLLAAGHWRMRVVYDRPSLHAAGGIIKLLLTERSELHVEEVLWAYEPRELYYEGGDGLQYRSDTVPPQIRAWFAAPPDPEESV